MKNSGVAYNNIQITKLLWTFVPKAGAITDTSALPIAIGDLAAAGVSSLVTLTMTAPQ